MRAAGYKSQFEIDVAALIPEAEYEPDKFEYTVVHKYNPDYKLRDGVYIEAKGLFTASDRAKHLHIKKQHPDLTIYFIFMNPNVKLSRASKTSYGDWATKHGFEYTTINQGIPQSWLAK